MTLSETIVSAFTFTGRRVTTLSSLQDSSTYMDDINDARTQIGFYNLRATDETMEIPIGVDGDELTPTDVPTVVTVNLQARNSLSCPKTLPSLLNNMLCNYNPILSVCDDEGNILYRRKLGYICTGNGVPIMEFTREVSRPDLHTTAYIIRLNRAYLDSQSKLADFLKGSFVRAALSSSIGGIPISLLVDTNMVDPIHLPEQVSVDNDTYQEEIQAILEEQGPTIVDNTLYES